MAEPSIGRRDVYDEQGHLLAGTPVLLLVHAASPPNSPPAVYFIHADQIDTPRIVQDGQYRNRWAWDADGFGQLPPNDNPQGMGSFTFNLRMPGQVFDAESGLFYNHFRDYDPQTGRYIESDPIGLAGGSWSTYVYSDGRPTSRIDFHGLANGPAIGWMNPSPRKEPSGPVVISAGVGGQGQILASGLGAESGIAVQLTQPRNICLYTQQCMFTGFGSIAGGLGISAQAQFGGGNLCKGNQQSKGIYLMLPGLSGQVTQGEDGSISTQKGMLDLGGTAPGEAFGYVQCFSQVFWCVR